MKNLKKALLAAAVATLALGAQAAVTLKLSHNQSKDIPVHKAMQAFADKVKEYTNGEVKIRIYPTSSRMRRTTTTSSPATSAKKS